MVTRTRSPVRVVAAGVVLIGHAGLASSGTIRVPADVPTLQAGLDQASSGDTVLVAPGTYAGSGNKDLRFGKNVVLLSEAGPEATLIDCEGDGRGFLFDAQEGPGCRVEGFQVRNGYPGDGENGGGMVCVGAGPILVDCEFRGNRTTGFGTYGAGAWVHSGSPVFDRCVFSGNEGWEGGGISVREGSDAVFRACTITGNRAEERGGGMVVSHWSHVELDRCIVWANCAGSWGDGVALSGSSDFAVVRCCLLNPGGVEGGNMTYDGESLYEDPRFCAPIECAAAPTVAGDFRLGANSPCLPASSPCGERIGARDTGCGDVYLGACCFSDRPCRTERPADCEAALGVYAGDDVPCDPDPCAALMGACCLDQSTCLITSEEECLQSGTGHFRLGQTCEPNPCGGLVLRVPAQFPTIQDALDAAFPGDTVLVSPGTYTGLGNRGLEFFGKAVLLLSESGAGVTVLDCESADRGLYFKHGETEGTLVRGFTIRNGALTGSGKGAGIACVGNSSPTIEECVFEANVAEDGGGGIYVGSAAPRFVECLVRGNVTANRGGGLWSYRAAPRFTGCRFIGNRSDGSYGGGAVHDQESTSEFHGCDFSGNEAQAGAGIRTLLSSPSFTDCVVAGNCAEYNGGGLFLAPSGSATLTGCTVADNLARNGGGISGGAAALLRTIVWGNCAEGVGDQIYANGGLLSLVCCDVDSSGLVGPIEIDPTTFFEDPAFCAPRDCADAPIEAFDYGLAAGSPCLPSSSPCGALVGALGESCVDPLVPGACCLAGAACRVIYESECAAAGGSYFGDGAVCEPNPCPGACCLPNDGCLFVAETECYEAGGACWRGGMTCEPKPCPMVYRVPSEFANIQSAIDAACPGTTVLVAPGVYRASVDPGNTNVDPRGKDLRVVSEQGPLDTILDLEHWGRGFTFRNGESRDFLLQGFTIRGGSVSENVGGGIRCDGSSPTILDCVIDDCRADGLVIGKGGGIACTAGASPAFLRCTITNCDAYDDSGPGGGGIFISGASPLFRQCEIRGNRSYSVGGAYLAARSTATFRDCVVAGNDGDGISADLSSTPILEGCTVTANDGIGIRADSTTVERSILWGNCSWDLYTTGAITLSCSAIDTASIGGPGVVMIEDGVVSEDPRFCGPLACGDAPTTDGDYTLASDSPCLPAASPCGRVIGALGVGCPVSSADPPAAVLPTQLRLHGPWPNPTGAGARWILDLPASSSVRVRAYDVRGAIVASVLEGVLAPGSHPIEWPARLRGGEAEVPSGVYWVRVESDQGSDSRSVTVIR